MRVDLGSSTAATFNRREARIPLRPLRRSYRQTITYVNWPKPQTVLPNHRMTRTTQLFGARNTDAVCRQRLHNAAKLPGWGFSQTSMCSGLRLMIVRS